ncbi:hypothetical protein [Acidimangrovimonas pyrenivorans]|uniref:STAS/SEC14 domain-containing protein n=1 Tax=Acidimangrovimonas pyrenivorans TaxID=2030798 RepID=A0ABV7ADL0_9RHOB
MSVTFTVFPRRGLVYVRYVGFTRFRETLAVFAEYSRHPDCRPGQKQLVDLSEVTGFDDDFAGLMNMQAQKADTFLRDGVQTLVVYYAPTAETYEMAGWIRNSWEGLDGIVCRVLQCEAEALELLGQPERSFDELMARAE